MDKELSPHEPSDDLIREQSQLVARGVRAVAIVGLCSADEMTMLRAATRLEMLADWNVIVFVVNRGDGTAEYGYAAAKWALDLLRWAMTSGPDTVPPEQRDRILGLLCGYSAEAIRLFEERDGGRLFRCPSTSLHAQASN